MLIAPVPGAGYAPGRAIQMVTAPFPGGGLRFRQGYRVLSSYYAAVPPAVAKYGNPVRSNAHSPRPGGGLRSRQGHSNAHSPPSWGLSGVGFYIAARRLVPGGRFHPPAPLKGGSDCSSRARGGDRRATSRVPPPCLLSRMVFTFRLTTPRSIHPCVLEPL